MSSISRVFADPHALLSLHVENLADLFRPYFSSLSGGVRGGALSCLSMAVQCYPQDVRRPLLDHLMAAWDFVHAEGLVESADRRRLVCAYVAITGLPRTMTVSRQLRYRAAS